MGKVAMSFYVKLYYLNRGLSQISQITRILSNASFGSTPNATPVFIVDPVITYTLSIGAVRKPHLPGVESVYLFFDFTICVRKSVLTR